jgi:hypothetical protein
MKSGSGDDINFSDKQLAEIQSLVLLFMENALKTSAMYVSHAKRTIVQIQDIKICMKIEAMLFCKKSNTIQKAYKLIQELFNDDEEEEDNNPSNDIFTDDEEEYTVSSCPCILCSTVRDLDKHWNNWKPETPLEIALKNNIDKFDLN